MVSSGLGAEHDALRSAHADEGIAKLKQQTFGLERELSNAAGKPARKDGRAVHDQPDGPPTLRCWALGTINIIENLNSPARQGCAGDALARRREGQALGASGFL